MGPDGGPVFLDFRPDNKGAPAHLTGRHGGQVCCPDRAICPEVLFRGRHIWPVATSDWRHAQGEAGPAEISAPFRGRGNPGPMTEASRCQRRRALMAGPSGGFQGTIPLTARLRNSVRRRAARAGRDPWLRLQAAVGWSGLRAGRLSARPTGSSSGRYGLTRPANQFATLCGHALFHERKQAKRMDKAAPPGSGNLVNKLGQVRYSAW